MSTTVETRNRGHLGASFRETPLASRCVSLAFPAFLCLFSVLFLFVASCVQPDPLYCLTDKDCVGKGEIDQVLICNTRQRACRVQEPNVCYKDSDCTSERLSRCNMEDNRCAPCLIDDPTDKSCSGFWKNTNGQCADLEGIVKCVECKQNSDCPSERPICDYNSCRPCQEHSDCEGTLKCENGIVCTDSLVCIREGDLTEGLAGSCAANGISSTGRVVYVDNTDLGICKDSDLNFGFDPSKPVCTTNRAYTIAQEKERRYIRIIGNNHNPIFSAISNGSYHFVGAPRKGKKQRAMLMGKNAFFDVTGDAKVTLDQIQIIETNVDTNVLKCSASDKEKTPELNVLRSNIRGNTPTSFPNPKMFAIDLSGCNVRITQSVIGKSTVAETLSNDADGAHSKVIKTWDYRDHPVRITIENNLIAGNTDVALSVGHAIEPGFQRIRFNTIVYNGRASAGVPGTIYCIHDGIIAQVTNNIIVGNRMNVDTQIVGGATCDFSDSTIGLVDSYRNVTLRRYDPVFSEDFTLQNTEANRRCCIDQLSPRFGEFFPTIDMANQPRPSGAKYDIGCFETQQK